MVNQPSIDPELNIVRDFLKDCIPFDQLPENELNSAAFTIQVLYFRSGHVFHSSDDNGGLRIIRSGAAELRSADGSLIDRFGEGVSFNLLSLGREQSGIKLTLIEDSLIYFLPEEAYQAIREDHRDFDRFFRSQRSRRVRRAARHNTTPSEMMSLVTDVMSKRVLSVTPDHSIQQAANLMTENRISSLLVMEEEKLLGILTDRDIRSRAVAQGRNFSSPVTDIMTVHPQTISSDKTTFDATLFMTQSGFHHIPVVDNDHVVGVVTSSDLMLARRDDPVYLVQHISRQQDCFSLAKAVAQLPDLMIQWTNAGIKAEQVAYIFTAVSDAVTVRLIELFIQNNGEPPVKFAWLGFGSQGRAEQLLGGDQDNALLIDNSLNEADADWFKRLAHWVCDGLNDCGYVYCPGKVMATTDEWRQNLNGWMQTVDRWTRMPTTDAVMRVSIFFDLRVVYGDTDLGASLHQYMLEKTSGNSIFLGALADNVLEHKPPLGIFRKFVVEHDGEHNDELNLKKRGILPIVDVARIHSLASKVDAVNTHDRLAQLAKLKVLTINESRNLQDALRVIMQVRLTEQVKELSAGQSPNNYVNPDNLSKLTRKQLKDAFSIINDAQQGIKMRYRPGL
jgi:CBS domain-containing protein